MNTDKFQSRKFCVWLTTTALVVATLIVSAIYNSEHIAKTAEIFAEGYIFVSTFYLGANAVSKFGNKNGNKKEVSGNEDIVIR